MNYDLPVSYIALEHLEESIELSDATEVYQFVLRTFDTFTRIINNFKTSLKGFNRNFKRSELLAYHESHPFMINQFFKTQQFNLDLSVPIPSGMKVTYLHATTILETLYSTLDINSTITALQFYFSEVQAGRFPVTEDTTKLISKISKNDVEKTLRDIFNANKTMEVPLRSVIPSFDELIVVDHHILGYDTIFKNVETVCSALDVIEKIIDTHVTSIETQTTPIDKVAVRALYQLVHTASVQLDMFGVILTELQRVEHNFVICLRRLVTTQGQR